MADPWIIGSLLAIVFFIVFEYRAFIVPDKQETLSRWIYNMATQFPLSIFWMGQAVGTLSNHFFWHWCPAGSISAG